jgi:rare lipoprotein A
MCSNSKDCSGDIEMTHVPNRLIAITVAMLVSACSSIQPTPTSDSAGRTEFGKASFYANKHQSRKTASGELYSHNLKTAAHRDLPFGTKIKVTNVKNGKSTVARVNDRGPYVKGRIVDLSKSAFSSIANTASGVIPVELEVVK